MKNSKCLLATILLSCHIALAFAGDVSAKLAAVSKGADQWQADVGSFRVMVIPASGGFLANKLVVASLKAGSESLSSQQISQLLLQQSPVSLAVTSENDGVGAATLERALLALKGKALVPHKLVFVGDSEYEEPLVAAAGGVGLKLVYVVSP